MSPTVPLPATVEVNHCFTFRTFVCIYIQNTSDSFTNTEIAIKIRDFNERLTDSLWCYHNEAHIAMAKTACRSGVTSPRLSVTAVDIKP